MYIRFRAVSRLYTQTLFSLPRHAGEEIQPLFSPASCDFLAFPEDLSIHYRLPKRFSSSSILLPIIFPWFSRIFLFLAELVCRAKMYHAAFQPDCVAIDCSGWLLMVSVVTRTFSFWLCSSNYFRMNLLHLLPDSASVNFQRQKEGLFLSEKCIIELSVYIKDPHYH